MLPPLEAGGDRGAVHGIAAVAGLIARTLGPAGRPAIVRDPAGGEIEASDAETIVACLAPGDPGDRLGTTYVRDLVRDQHAVVPDGAATAVVLAGAMIRQAVAAMEEKADPQGLARGIAAARDRVADELQRRAADLQAKEEIAAVTAAAVFDRALADVVAEAFDKVGKDGVITVEPAVNQGIELALSRGMTVDGGYVSAEFVTDAERGEAVLRDPLVLLVDAELTGAEELLPAVGAATSAGRPLAVFAAGVTGTALAALTASRTNGSPAALAASVAGDPYTRKSVLGDLAVVTGATVAGGSAPGSGVAGGITAGGPAPALASAVPPVLGSAGKVVATRDRAFIVDGAADTTTLTGRIWQLRAAIGSVKSAAERQELETRMVRLIGGAATIRTGGVTSAETARLVARAERGLKIARLAMQYPVIPGGGAALADVRQALAKFPRSVPGGRAGDEAAGARIVLDSLTAPMRQLAENAGVPASAIEKALKSRKEGAGIDPATGQLVPMRPHALDILPVVQAAVTNAAALTIRLLTG